MRGKPAAVISFLGAVCLLSSFPKFSSVVRGSVGRGEIGSEGNDSNTDIIENPICSRPAGVKKNKKQLRKEVYSSKLIARSVENKTNELSKSSF